METKSWVWGIENWIEKKKDGAFCLLFRLYR